MVNIREKIKLVLRKNSVLVLVLCAGWFVVSIILLFTQEKHRLDAEFESMIIDSLNIHTQSNAAEINQIITEAERAIHTAETMLSYSGIDGSIRDRLERRNANVPIYPTNYISLEEMRANLSSFFTPANQGKALARLMQGETMVGDICYDENLGKYFLAILLPLREGEAITGALYTRLQADGLFPQISESAVYQGVQNCLVTSEGDIVFNTFVPEQGGNLFESLDAYHLTETEIDRIASIISSPDIDSSIFIRHGEAYYVSAARLEYNGWHLVSFVRGPDVLLRSSEIFQSVIRTSIGSILLTAAAVCVVFMMLLFNRKKLEEEQQRNKALAQRLEAMFEQHSALKVVFDAETGKIVEVNPAILKYFGYTRTEVLGRSIYEFNLLPPEIIDEKFKNINGDVLFSSAPHLLKGGKTRLFDAYASTVMDGDNRLFYAILFDVTDREVYRNELLQEKELLKTTLQSIGDGVVTTDNFGFITSLNSVAEKLTGWDRGTAVGRYFTEVFTLRNEDTGQPVENPIQKVLATGLVVGLANHTEMVNRQGECIPIADSAAPIKAEDGQTFGVVMVFRDVSDEKEHIKQIEFLSYHDSLTGLYNRHYIEETMTRLDAAEYLPVSVVMADVNGLKITNDVFGHKAGDALLKKSADLMRKCCKEDDLIARWGGDEFVILMPGTSLEEAEAVIQKIKNAHITIEDGSLSLSLSLGCACKDTAEDSIQTAMQQGEKYMYQQKLLEGKSFRNAIISTLLATLYEKSYETEEHSKRIETYCHAIGRELQLSSKEMDEISLLALLHDIGKVSINPHILQKPGALTPGEWDEMKRHPEIGYRIAQAAPELAVVADLILSHHERWDGQGYPRGLKEGEIPLACRILAVVDAFDAMTNDRVYRQAMSLQDALKEIKMNEGKQFDPQVANLLIEIIVNENESLLGGDMINDQYTKAGE